MKLLAATAALCLLTQGPLIQNASAQTRNCKALTDPLDRLTCNAEVNPQAAAGQRPKPPHYIPRPDRTLDSTGISDSGDEAKVNQKINGICRGC